MENYPCAAAAATAATASAKEDELTACATLSANNTCGNRDRQSGRADDRGISAANLDTRAQLVTKDTVGEVGKRYEN